MIGLEIHQARSIAVSIDEAGRLLARADVAGQPSTSALAALREVGGVHCPAVIASPVDHPSTVIAEAIAALTRDQIPSTLGDTPTGSGVGAVSHTVAVAPSGTAAAVAEAWVGAASGVKDVVFFAVDAHATAGILRGGAPAAGAHGRAATVAWMSLNPVEREDYRKTGCVDAEVAAAGIVRRLVWRIKSGDESRVQQAVNGNLGAITLRHVLEAARDGDGVAVSVTRDTAKYLGMAAANLVAIVDPEILVLGGIMVSAPDLLFDPVRTEITRRLPNSIADALAVVPAALGDDAAAIGAARLGAAAPR